VAQEIKGRLTIRMLNQTITGELTVTLGSATVTGSTRNQRQVKPSRMVQTITADDW
jgi:hypothetical protein